MNRRLRKRHFAIWIILGISLPIGFFAAYQAIPKPVNVDQQVLFGLPQAYEIVEKTYESEAFDARIRVGATSGMKQFEIQWKQPMPNSSQLVYLDDNELLGTTGGASIFRINFDSTLSQRPLKKFSLKDPITKDITHSISF